jgi:hypothetical protein
MQLKMCNVHVFNVFSPYFLDLGDSSLFAKLVLFCFLARAKRPGLGGAGKTSNDTHTHTPDTHAYTNTSYQARTAVSQHTLRVSVWFNACREAAKNQTESLNECQRPGACQYIVVRQATSGLIVCFEQLLTFNLCRQSNL